MSKEVKCRHCGTPNPKDAAFCRNCGKKLKGKSIRQAFVIGVCLSAIIVCFKLMCDSELAIDTDNVTSLNLPKDTTDTVTVVATDAVEAVAECDTLPSATIDSIWLEHQVTEGEEKGMVVHVKFKTHYMQGKDGLVATYVYYSDGQPLKDTNGRCTAGGNVATKSDIKPIYKHSVFEDRTIFIPYSELHLSSSCEGLYVTCVVFCGDTPISPEVKQRTSFSFTKGD